MVKSVKEYNSWLKEKFKEWKSFYCLTDYPGCKNENTNNAIISLLVMQCCMAWRNANKGKNDILCIETVYQFTCRKALLSLKPVYLYFFALPFLYSNMGLLSLLKIWIFDGLSYKLRPTFETLFVIWNTPESRESLQYRFSFRNIIPSSKSRYSFFFSSL